MSRPNTWQGGTAGQAMNAADLQGMIAALQGPGEYTYGLGAAFWAPNWQWIAADDGRILIITTGHPTATRCSPQKAARAHSTRSLRGSP